MSAGYGRTSGAIAATRGAAGRPLDIPPWCVQALLALTGVVLIMAPNERSDLQTNRAGRLTGSP